MYAKVKVRLEPASEGSGYQFKEELPTGMIPPGFVNAVNSAIQDAMKFGVLAGQEIVDLRAVLCDGGYHREQSSESAFRIAASIAFKKAVRKADPVVLEPIMAVEVRGPEEHLIISSIIGDLKSRRGEITGLEHQENSLVIQAIVPMPEMIGYGSFLRSNSQGYGEYATRLIRFADALSNGSGGNDISDVPVEPTDPKPDPGADQAGVPALKPRGPKPMSRSAAAKIGSEPE
jgi:elongation factor G